MNPQNPMNGSYGVPRDVYAKVKQAGFVMVDLGIIFIAMIVGMNLGFNLFPTNQLGQMIAFILLTPVMALYLLLPSDGDKKNWQSLYLALKRRKKRYISFDWLEEEE